MPTVEKNPGSDVLASDQKITRGNFFRILGGAGLAGLTVLGGSILTSATDAEAKQVNRKPAGKDKKKPPEVIKGGFKNTFIDQYSASNYEKMDNLKPLGKWLGKDWTLAFLFAYYVNTAGKGHLAGCSVLATAKVPYNKQIELEDKIRAEFGEKIFLKVFINDEFSPDLSGECLVPTGGEEPDLCKIILARPAFEDFGFTDVQKIKIVLKDYGRGSKKMIDHEIIEYQAPDYQANSLQ